MMSCQVARLDHSSMTSRGRPRQAPNAAAAAGESPASQVPLAQGRPEPALEIFAAGGRAAAAAVPVLDRPTARAAVTAAAVRVSTARSRRVPGRGPGTVRVVGWVSVNIGFHLLLR